jgi:hypothetical protein
MAERFEIESYILIFDNDDEFNNSLFEEGEFPLTSLEKENLVSLLIDNNTYISSNTVVDLVGQNFIKTSIDETLGFSTSTSFYKQIFYTYKYASTKSFFKKNYSKFLPPYDVVKLQDDNGKKQLFIEAFVREFDKFCDVIDKIYNIVDIDKIPLEYVNYLAQLIGYEREDYLLISDISYRELLKNIIEIYKIKGTNYSFELFFGFLGYDITIREFWFDKRLADEGITANLYTSVTSKTNLFFYLTPLKPTEYIPEGMLYPILVNENEIKDTMDLNKFQRYINLHFQGDSDGYSYQQLIGDTPGYTGDTYTYFKTNIIQYSLTSLRTYEDIELGEDDLNIIALYVKFLTPIFISPRILLAAAPYETSAFSQLFFSDDERSDPVFNRINNYAILSITSKTGDTGDTHALIYVSDPKKELFNHYLHRGDFIYIGDTDTSPPIGDTDNVGSYFVAGDTDGDSYAVNIGSTTIIKLKKYLAADQATAGGYVFIGGNENMFHLYEGIYPSNYYWGDTEIGDSWEMNYNDANIPGKYEYFNLSFNASSNKGRVPNPRSVEKNIERLDYRRKTSFGDSLLTKDRFYHPRSKYWSGLGLKENRKGTVGFWKGDTGDSNVVPQNFTNAVQWNHQDCNLYRDNYYINNWEIFRITSDDLEVSNFISYLIPTSILSTSSTVQIVFIRGTNNKSAIEISDDVAGTKCLASVNFSTGAVSLITGDTMWYTWLDDDKQSIWIAVTSNSIVPTNNNTLKIYGQYIEDTPISGTCYFATPKINRKGFPVPFDIKTPSNLVYGKNTYAGDTFYWVPEGSIEIYVYPYFKYDDTKNHVIFSDGDTDGTWHLRFIYNESNEKFSLQVSDDGGSSSDVLSFGKGDSYIYKTLSSFSDNSILNDWHWFKIYWDSPNLVYKVWAGGKTETGGDTVYYIGQLTTSNVGDSLPFNNVFSVGYDQILGDSSIFEGEMTDLMFFRYGHISTSHFYVKKPYLYVREDYEEGTVKKGGHFISNHYNDTRTVVYDRTYYSSAYNEIKRDNPLFNDEQIHEEINRLHQTQGIFDYTKYKIRNRDFLPFVDSTRKNVPGDTYFGKGDTFTLSFIGDSYLQFGDTSHGFIKNTYVIISGEEYLITEATTGDSRIKVFPFAGDSGIIYPRYSYLNYYNINEEGDSTGDSVYRRGTGFINVLLNNKNDLNETSNITLGSNLPLEVNSEGRPFENQDTIWKTRNKYYEFNYTSAGDSFLLGEIITGDSSGAKAVVSSYGGDSKFFSFRKVGYFFTGETITGDSSGTTATLSSLAEKVDRRGRILFIDVVDGSNGKVQVYDPMLGDSAWTTEFDELTSDSFVYLYNLNNGDTTEGLFRVDSSARSGTGDTVIITFGDSLPGSDQGDSGGYVIVSRVGLIQEMQKLGAGDSKGVIKIYDTSSRYTNLKAGDSIEVFDRGDTNEGAYYLFADPVFSSGVTTIRVGDSLPGDSGDSGGFIRSKINYWDLGDSHFPFDFDYLDFIKIHI